MKKVIFFAFVFASLILIAPITTIAQENKVTNNISEQTFKESLITQIKDLTDKILQKYGHLPMVKVVSFYIQFIFLQILDTLCYFTIICAIFIDILLNHIWLETGKRFNAIRTLGGTIFLTAWVICIAPFTITLPKNNEITNSIKDCPCLQE
ncbi:MAG: hypothetical protein AYK22_09085 [Thermoplasmatales archaeon SG8-52-3]|nr:MAG: hypothetical protein AYK22_09085 [Thermoplasmatales archaeon SG8-52-3]